MSDNEVKTSYFKLKDLGEFVGVYTGTFIGGIYDSATHYFKNDAGEPIGINGFKVLNEELAKFDEGDKVKLVYEGMKKGKNFPYHAAAVLPAK